MSPHRDHDLTPLGGNARVIFCRTCFTHVKSGGR